MLIAGIDLAAENTNTAVAWIRWTATGAGLEELVVGAGDDELLRAASAADKAGIDCPLGWPEPFVEFIIAHHRGELAAPTDLIGRDWRRKLAWRRTDVVTHELTGRLSLSVAADRIAHTAMRCAAMLARLAEDGQRGPQWWRNGRRGLPCGIAETVGLPYQGYKGRQNSGALNDLMDRLTTDAPWLQLGAFEPTCQHSDHAIDAVVAALTARAAAIGRATRPSAGDMPVAATEGRIALLTAPLTSLTTAGPKG